MAVVAAIMAAMVGWAAGPVHAGGGPENVVLVVNELSDDSKEIANHYINRRDIPLKNVVYLPWRGSVEQCKVGQFREEILKPVLDQVNKRGLALQADYVVYSAGFPWRIDLRPDFPKIDFPKQLEPYASITGATYLWESTGRKNPTIFSLDANWYVPKSPANNLVKCASLAGVKTQAFRGRYRWLKGGTPKIKAEGSRRYLISTMLGVTSGRGNTVREVLAYLDGAVRADRTQPQGTFYFTINDDVRSGVRHACYQGVAAALREEGADAQVLQGVAPKGVTDILGLTTGHRECYLQPVGSKV
ncbi:MAG: hypothetical protein AAF589_01770, partial [Planctomycetota bacterium]